MTKECTTCEGKKEIKAHINGQDRILMCPDCEEGKG